MRRRRRRGQREEEGGEGRGGAACVGEAQVRPEMAIVIISIARCKKEKCSPGWSCCCGGGGRTPGPSSITPAVRRKAGEEVG